ncbi:hypothetical protein EW146_g8371 [Bondarzewia mesenterica]|uniref:Integrase catalytic domain-containing protein n=1 Tax=Bondarzewia mesenterica TaxID=1095465 RepID=A0A4S4LF50_9AGAM|nr:hypothetical protein EW146_g8371 [Bondarzewia mesenterica]
MARNDLVTGMPTTTSVPPKCDACILGKQTKRSVPYSRTHTCSTVPLAVVYADLMGPVSPASTGAILLVQKSDAASSFLEWRALTEADSGHQLHIVRTDSGGEFTLTQFEQHLRQSGITHQTSAPYTSAHIRAVERLHRTLFDQARAMRISADLPLSLWGECYLTAAYLHNRTATHTLHNMTPDEAWSGSKPDISHLREFGCRAFVLIQDHHNPKIHNRSIECILVGYSPHSKSYRCYHHPSGRIYVSYHVTFIESHHSPQSPSSLRDTSHSTSPVSRSASPPPVILDTTLPARIHDDDLIPFDTPSLSPSHSPSLSPSYSMSLPPPTISSPLPSLPPLPPEPPLCIPEPPLHIPPSAPPLRRSTRLRKPSAKLLASIGEPSLPSTLSPPSTPVPSTTILSTPPGPTPPTPLSPLTPLPSDLELLGLAAVELNDEPRTWAAAQASADADKWRTAYLDELCSICSHDVYDLVPRSSVPHDRRVIKCRPIFTIKRDAHNNPVHYKARLVAKGFTQIPGQDFTDTFSPVARLESQRLLLHLATHLGWPIEQLDVKTAFLHGNLTEDLWMEQPDGFHEPDKEDWVWKLKKRPLRSETRQPHLEPEITSGPPQFWVHTHQRGMEPLLPLHAQRYCILTIHVDDLNLAGSTTDVIQSVKLSLHKHFDIIELSPVQWLVGLAITRNLPDRTITVSQTGLIDSILTKFRLTDAHTVSTPLDYNVKLTHADCPSLDSDKQLMATVPYRELISCLMYLSIGSRPDISFAVQHLSQFNANPGPRHWTAVKHVVHYLKGTRTTGLILGGSQPLTLYGFTDASFGSAPGPIGSRRSVSGFGFSLGSGLISWSSKRQSLMATSTCEAEFIAAAHACKEALWFRTILTSLNFKPTSATLIYCDNQSAIRLTQDQAFHDKSKHIDIQHHFIRDHVALKHIHFAYVPTNDNIVDAFTKPLPKAAHQHFRTLIGLHPLLDTR